MELHADEPGVVRDLDDLRQLAVRRQAGEQQARLLQHLPVVDVHLVAVAVALADRIRAVDVAHPGAFLEDARSEEHTSELQSLMRISYAVFGLKHKNTKIHI